MIKIYKITSKSPWSTALVYKLKGVAVTSLLPKFPNAKLFSKVLSSEKWLRAVLSVVPTFVTALPEMAVYTWLGAALESFSSNVTITTSKWDTTGVEARKFLSQFPAYVTLVSWPSFLMLGYSKKIG